MSTVKSDASFDSWVGDVLQDFDQIREGNEGMSEVVAAILTLAVAVREHASTVYDAAAEGQ